MTAQLAAIVLTRNEERHIGACLESVAWVDDCLVVDSSSTDRTVDIAEAHDARVVQHRFVDFASQRNYALDEAQSEWVLFVDADERATPALAEEVRRTIGSQGAEARVGWWIPRHNYMIGHRMRGGGWYPDYQLRLLRCGRARYDPARPVHEVVILDGDAGHLKNVLVHYNYESVGQFRHKMKAYTVLEARILQNQGVQVRPWTYVSMPVREFLRRFLALGGYKDHVYGLLFCGLMSWYTFVTYWRLRDQRLGNG